MSPTPIRSDAGVFVRSPGGVRETDAVTGVTYTLQVITPFFDWQDNEGFSTQGPGTPSACPFGFQFASGQNHYYTRWRVYAPAHPGGQVDPADVRTMINRWWYGRTSQTTFKPDDIVPLEWCFGSGISPGDDYSYVDAAAVSSVMAHMMQISNRIDFDLRSNYTQFPDAGHPSTFIDNELVDCYPVGQALPDPLPPPEPLP